MRVLVTGASGLLGREVARLLVRQGHAVTTFQRRPSGVDGAADICGSVADDDAVRRAVAGAEGIIHLAAKVSFTGRAADFDEVNVEGTRRLLRAAREAGVRDLVFVSSPSVANSGAAIAGLGAEPADPARAHGDYSRTKAEAELLALAADCRISGSRRCARTSSGAPATRSWWNGCWNVPAAAACRCSTPGRP